MLKAPKKKYYTLKFRIKSALMRTSIGNTIPSVRVYSIEVKTQEIRELMAILKENTKPGIFVPI
jgi:hypothetical protein